MNPKKLREAIDSIITKYGCYDNVPDEVKTLIGAAQSILDMSIFMSPYEIKCLLMDYSKPGNNGIFHSYHIPASQFDSLVESLTRLPQKTLSDTRDYKKENELMRKTLRDINESTKVMLGMSL